MHLSASIMFCIWAFILSCGCLLAGYSSFAQGPVTSNKDFSGLNLSVFPSADDSSYRCLFDSSTYKSLLSRRKDKLNKFFPSFKKDSLLKPDIHAILKKDSLKNIYQPPLQGPQRKSPLLAFHGGYLNYDFSYRSNIDTPYIEKNIYQHQTFASMNFTIADILPIRVSSFVRRSNSSLFQNITDVQLAFDAAAYRNQLRSKLQSQLMSRAPGLKDSLTEKLYQIKSLQSKNFRDWLNNNFNRQKLIEAYEILNVPQKAYDLRLPDSVNRKRADTLQKLARAYLELYSKTKSEYDRISEQTDSLKKEYEKSLKRIKQYEQLAKGQFGSYSSYEQWKNELQQYVPDAADIPSKYRWLLGIRTLGIGKNAVNTSELTAKNINLTGLHFEYNSWYFFGITAGMVDYRFRDFNVNQVKTPQYLYMLRLGIGRLEKNYFIISTYRGQKQLFASSSNAGLNSIRITGFSAEAKWQLTPSAYVIGEVGQSISPDFRSGSGGTKTSWSLSDKSNKGLSLKLYSYFPKTASRIEAQYKFTGANFQSFNSFQTNAEVKAWLIKAEQGFFRNKLKLTAAVRSNDFSNPYIVQNYKSNTVFTTISAMLRLKKWPMISVGYMPMSQLSKVGNQLSESRFQTLNASISHFYKIGDQRAATSMVYTRFYNSGADSGFIYYNAVNLFISQTVYFRYFTNNIGVTHSKSPGYEYNVMEESFSFPVKKRLTAGGGVKINFMNETQSKVGGYVNAGLRINQNDMITLRFESSYLPGSGNKLVSNTLGNINFSKSIR